VKTTETTREGTSGSPDRAGSILLHLKRLKRFSRRAKGVQRIAWECGLFGIVAALHRGGHERAEGSNDGFPNAQGKRHGCVVVDDSPSEPEACLQLVRGKWEKQEADREAGVYSS
jgi:hypothetical protein